ncbi:FAD-binding oxidoreductase [Marivirga arenosa]|uniref:FAD-linked oxidase C-terminal domain-containing protein n=1 Tax=Marivirga arenosa TaxID=3059076 RepID=A0AA51N7X4_9BACT|nr:MULTISPECIES: FAD-linked oxidase C-terminal domain-containing protein [unclassified Marivirga]WMN07794.1 FAD-linked oxidase C-terminal domain-containing protein [Marivirga sp. ABR2-2]WNB17975.1 FAD-linked oxidase C-terminal domain-containing protein [Marivirga sp. BKB1-2]
MDTVTNQSIFEELVSIVGAKNAYLQDEDKYKYSHDHTEDYSFMPDVVLKPSTPEEISAIMKKCNEHLIPVTPRGGGTGLSGGALPTKKGVVISMEKFNNILSIDELNLQATVEPGVITEVFQNAVKEKGLFYPPDPSSKGSCFLGGNLAENAGGPKAVKYGVTRDYVLNMEVVLANGEIIWTAANVLKNSTGYNLTQLMCGSEGTLGIITKIVFKLRPYPKKDVTLLAPFTSNEEACRAIAAIFKAGVAPSGMEFMERDAIEKTQTYIKEEMGESVTVDLPDHIKAHLLIELDGNDEEVMMNEAETILNVLEDFDTGGEVLFADTQARKDELWKLRRNVSPAVNAYSLTKAEDVVVPRGNLPALIVFIKEVGKKYGFNSVCYGHAGDGNLHINIMKEDLSDDYWNNEVNEGIGEIFKEVVKLGGTLSGEHGIGIAKRPYMQMAMGDVKLDLMRGIKKAFDPNTILNPEKIF